MAMAGSLRGRPGNHAVSAGRVIQKKATTANTRAVSFSPRETGPMASSSDSITVSIPGTGREPTVKASRVTTTQASARMTTASGTPTSIHARMTTASGTPTSIHWAKPISTPKCSAI
jgi:hypothetical protein